MTNRLELNWKLDGLVDEQRYYCSETPFTAETRPAPKTVLANDVRTYVDTAVDVDKTYYVAVGSVKNSVEKLSNIIKRDTIDHLLNMPFSVDKNDHGKFGLVATTVGSAVIQSGYLYIPENSYLSFDVSGITELNLGLSDFEFGVEVALMPGGGAEYPCLFGVGSVWESGAISMQFNPSSVFMCAIRNPDEQDAFSPSSQVRDGTTFVKYVVRRIDGVWTTYKDNVAGTPLTDNTFIANFTKNGVITIGAAVWELGSTASHSKIKNVYLKTL